MDTARHVVAVIIIVSFPPAFGFWLLAHPFMRFWRSLGPGLSYAIILCACIAGGVVTYRLRDSLLTVDYGTVPAFWPLAVLLYGLAIYIEIRVRRHLKRKILLGVPEFWSDTKPGRLLTGPRQASEIRGSHARFRRLVTLRELSGRLRASRVERSRHQSCRHSGGAGTCRQVRRSVREVPRACAQVHTAVGAGKAARPGVTLRRVASCRRCRPTLIYSRAFRK